MTNEDQNENFFMTSNAIHGGWPEEVESGRGRRVGVKDHGQTLLETISLGSFTSKWSKRASYFGSRWSIKIYRCFTIGQFF